MFFLHLIYVQLSHLFFLFWLLSSAFFWLLSCFFGFSDFSAYSICVSPKYILVVAITPWNGMNSTLSKLYNADIFSDVLLKNHPALLDWCGIGQNIRDINLLVSTNVMEFHCNYFPHWFRKSFAVFEKLCL